MEPNKKIELIQLPIDEIRKVRGLENLTDEEANNIATSLKELSLLTYQIFSKEIESKDHSSGS